MKQLKIAKVWIDDSNIYAETSEGKVARYAFSDWPKLRNASQAEREAFELSYGSIHWPSLDEDLSFEGMFADAGLCEITANENSVCYYPDSDDHASRVADDNGVEYNKTEGSCS